MIAGIVFAIVVPTRPHKRRDFGGAREQSKEPIETIRWTPEVQFPSLIPHAHPAGFV
jgi:ABC-type cobalt transport system substrate-binding protein